MKKYKLSSLVFALVAIGTASFFIIKNNALQAKLQEASDKQVQLEKTLEYYEQIEQVDALLAEGNYEDALTTSKQQLQQIEGGHNGVELRIALANKMIEMNKGLRKRASEADSLQIDGNLSGQETLAIAKIDSLQFALEKTQVRLNRLKKRFRENSGGAYLTFTNSKGSQVHYVGEVKDGMANGNGIAILNTGSRYKGQWKNNKRHGEGTFHWPDGDYYTGSYDNDKRNGQGTYHWHNGEKFVGLWEDDERTGEGVFYNEEGTVVAQGVWDNDELVEAEKL